MRFLEIGSSIAMLDFDESGIVFFLCFTKLILSQIESLIVRGIATSWLVFLSLRVR